MPELVESSVDDYRVALLRLNSPETRNALGAQMRRELLDELERLDRDPDVRCMVIVGSEKIFAAGADIRAMAERGLEAPPDPEGAAFWTRLAAIETPLVAAVAGYALGGGGTQRLTRAIGKQRAMEYVLTGRHFNAQMAAGWGLVNRAIPKGAWLTEAVELARTVAARPPIATRLAKQAVLAAEEEGISAGLRAERRLFEETMATEDRIEGMTAFIEKREPDFKGR